MAEGDRNEQKAPVELEHPLPAVREHGKPTRAELSKRHIEDPAAFEPTDTSSKGVLIFIAGLLASIGLVLAGVAWLFGFFGAVREPVEPFPLPKASQVPPEPRLEVAGPRDLRGFRAQEDAILDTYGWVDRNAEIVRIPIERAMDLTAQRGLPARTGPGPAPASPAAAPPSGGPRTGQPQPRGLLSPVTTTSSAPLRGAPQAGALPPAVPAPGGRPERGGGQTAAPPGARRSPPGGAPQSSGP